MYKAKNLYHNNVATHYDQERFGSIKGKLYDFLEKFSITRALRYVSKTYSILDIPCGTGRITKHIKDLGYKVLGADISEDMLKVARQKDMTFVREDVERTTFENKAFSGVVCVRLMGHLPNDVKIKVLKELQRIAEYLIVTFYMKKKEIKEIPNWYPLTRKELQDILNECKLNTIASFSVCPLWSDGVTYLLG